jgi:hypothetical protein
VEISRECGELLKKPIFNDSTLCILAALNDLAMSFGYKLEITVHLVANTL